MARYFIRARKALDDDDWWPEPAMNHVPTVCDHEAVDTGLVDSGGNAIMRAPNPMGFGRDDEW